MVWWRAGYVASTRANANRTTGLPNTYRGGGSYTREALEKLVVPAGACGNLLRAAGSLASLAYGKARGATIRRDLIDVAARTARHGRGRITLHLPEAWHREHE